MATVNPYITFPGNCEDAFNLYRTVFGGEYFGMCIDQFGINWMISFAES